MLALHTLTLTLQLLDLRLQHLLATLLLLAPALQLLYPLLLRSQATPLLLNLLLQDADLLLLDHELLLVLVLHVFEVFLVEAAANGRLALLARQIEVQLLEAVLAEFVLGDDGGADTVIELVRRANLEVQHDYETLGGA